MLKSAAANTIIDEADDEGGIRIDGVSFVRRHSNDEHNDG